MCSIITHLVDEMDQFEGGGVTGPMTYSQKVKVKIQSQIWPEIKLLTIPKYLTDLPVWQFPDGRKFRALHLPQYYWMDQWVYTCGAVGKAAVCRLWRFCCCHCHWYLGPAVESPFLLSTERLQKGTQATIFKLISQHLPGRETQGCWWYADPTLNLMFSET